MQVLFNAFVEESLHTARRGLDGSMDGSNRILSVHRLCQTQSGSLFCLLIYAGCNRGELLVGVLLFFESFLKERRDI
jgi:hypothetical protein